MFRQPLVIILSFGLLGSGIDGRCRGDKNCGGQALTRKQKHHASKSARFSQIRFSPCRTRHYHITRFCTDCRIDDCNGDRNAISDNCWNCCCNRFSLPSSSSSTSSITNASSESEGDATALETGCIESSDCNPADEEDSDFSKEDGKPSTSALSIFDKTAFESKTKCQPPPPCPMPPPCPPPPSCPTTSNSQQFSQDSETQIMGKNLTLSMLPEGVPIIPSPQLDMLTGGGNIDLRSIHDLHLSTIKPPTVEKPLAKEPAPVDNFPPHDCCTRCSGANCMQRNSNAIIFGASTFKNRQNRSMKCKNKELGKLMIANIKRDPTRSKRAIQRAAEKKFAAQFNVICSRGHFSYVTHTSEYCEVSNRGTICYAFKIH